MAGAIIKDGGSEGVHFVGCQFSFYEQQQLQLKKRKWPTTLDDPTFSKSPPFLLSAFSCLVQIYEGHLVRNARPSLSQLVFKIQIKYL